MRQYHILHVFPTFAAAGAQVRAVTLINSMGPSWRHSILSLDGNHGAASRLDNSATCAFLQRPLACNNLLAPLHFRHLVQNLAPDLVTTYNWGAMDAVIGARVASVCPIIHGEDGFGADEAVRLKTRRVLTRRVFLNTIHTTVVPSRVLERIALTQYRVSPSKVRFIPNGVDTEHFRPTRIRDQRIVIGADTDTVVFGYVGELRREKHLDLLLRAFSAARLPDALLVIVGDGPCREELQVLTRELGISDRVRFMGRSDNPTQVYASLDVFVMSSMTEQMPMSLLEAMATGLPAICTDVGDIATMLSSGPPQVVPKDDAAAFAGAMERLAADPVLRHTLGHINRMRCTSEYSLGRMLRQYMTLYETAVEVGVHSRRTSDEHGEHNRTVQGI